MGTILSYTPEQSTHARHLFMTMELHQLTRDGTLHPPQEGPRISSKKIEAAHWTPPYLSDATAQFPKRVPPDVICFRAVMKSRHTNTAIACGPDLTTVDAI